MHIHDYTIYAYTVTCPYLHPYTFTYSTYTHTNYTHAQRPRGAAGAGLELQERHMGGCMHSGGDL
ncbi:hypothetical protein EON63_00230 [archaeon]|nr:MAG: hypothetical protein EON63_00230 [archaeon]